MKELNRIDVLQVSGGQPQKLSDLRPGPQNTDNFRSIPPAISQPSFPVSGGPGYVCVNAGSLSGCVHGSLTNGPTGGSVWIKKDF